MRTTRFALATAACALVTAAGAGAVATPPFQTVMTGLNNPRGLAWGPEGALYVAEAGSGGTMPCFSTPRGPAFAGLTGAVSRLWHGAQERIATGLPSYTENAPSGVAATGPHDIALLGRGNARVSIGLGNDPALRSTCGALGPMFGRLAQVPASGNWRLEADIAAYELDAPNPDGGIIESNPYGLLAAPGATIATDAGGNDLLRVAADGSISTLAVFPSRSTIPPHVPFTDSVPTSVAVGPDGAYYVGELTGGPFFAGAANVYRVVPGQAPTVFRSGFSFIIDITFGPDGSLYVLQFSSLAGNTGPGELWRVTPGGVRTLVATGLVAPGSVTIGPDGAFYISNCSIFSTVGAGPPPCNNGGQVVRIPG
jgi:hypothetical protein